MNKYLVIIDEISLVGARMLNSIDQTFYTIKHIHNKPFANLGIILIGDLLPSYFSTRHLGFKKIQT
jgi:hypothetical protein